jgi:hypothetical protein
MGTIFLDPSNQVDDQTMNMYILVMIDYVIKWVEAKTLHTNIVVVTLLQLYLNSYMSLFKTRFGCPLTIITYQGVHFINDVITY